MRRQMVTTMYNNHNKQLYDRRRLLERNHRDEYAVERCPAYFE